MGLNLTPRADALQRKTNIGSGEIWKIVDDTKLGNRARREEKEQRAKADSATLTAEIGRLEALISGLEAAFATNAEVTEAIKQARSEITDAYTAAILTAKDELCGAINESAEYDARELAKTVAELKGLIDSAEAYADTQDAALKAELEEIIQSALDRIEALESRTPIFKVENGTLYVRYDENEEWTQIGVVQGADGQDGITPQLRINSQTNEWEASYDNGETWTSLGVKATGEKGEQGVQGEKGDIGAAGADGKDGTNGLTVAATVIGGTALASNIALIAYFLIKKKRLF